MKLRLLSNGNMITLVDEDSHRFQALIRLVVYLLAGVFLFIPNPLIEFVVTGKYPIIFGIRTDLYFMLFLWLNVYGLYHYPKVLFPSEIIAYQRDNRLVIHRGEILPNVSKIVVEEYDYQTENSEIGWDIRIEANGEIYQVFNETGDKTGIDDVKSTLNTLAYDLDIEFAYRVRDNKQYNDLQPEQMLFQQLYPQNLKKIEGEIINLLTSITHDTTSITLIHKIAKKKSFLKFDNIFVILYFGSIVSMFVSFMSVLVIWFFVYPFPINVFLELSGYIGTTIFMYRDYVTNTPNELEFSIEDDKITVMTKSKTSVNTKFVERGSLAKFEKVFQEGELVLQFMDITDDILASVAVSDNYTNAFDIIQQMIYTKWYHESN